MTLSLSSRSFLSLAAFALAAFAGGACSSSTSGTSSGGTSGSGTSGTTTGTPVSSADCQSRCEKKFTACGGDSASSKSNCSAQVCNGSVTSEQLTCLENKECNDIANASSFASLCPGGSTTTTPPATGGATCGSATCGTGEYCSLTYDSSTMAWTPSSCKKVPAACTSSSASSLCTCMKDNSGCPTSGVISTKCSQSDGALQFGCE